jgi:gamma-glutamylcyclotransferase (GGCT)/AIG2-like uncharacterized protein YtfP
MKDSCKLFVYGTLLDKRIEREVFADLPLEQIPDKLWGCRLVSVDISHTEKGYRTLVPDGAIGDAVQGRVLVISRRDLQEADTWEDHYNRVPVVLASGTVAWAYVMKRDVYDSAIARHPIAE